MSQLDPQQQRTRERVEQVIRLMSPGLSLVLAVGERISRMVEPEDHEYYPPRTTPVEPPPPGPGTDDGPAS